jgi:hypothetical protein
MSCLCACHRAASVRARAPPPPHGRRRAATCQRQPGVVATPSRGAPGAVAVSVGFLDAFAGGAGGTPRVAPSGAAPSCAAPSARRAASPEIKLTLFAVACREVSRCKSLRVLCCESGLGAVGFCAGFGGEEAGRPHPCVAVAVTSSPVGHRQQAFYAVSCTAVNPAFVPWMCRCRWWRARAPAGRTHARHGCDPAAPWASRAAVPRRIP